MSKLFLFGIGGTGARVIRSFTMLMASCPRGFDSDLQIVPIILDHDKGNGDLTRTKNLLDNYRQINAALYPNAGKTLYSDAFFAPRMIPLKAVGTIGGKGDWHVEFGTSATNQSQSFSDYIGLSTIASDAALKQTEALTEALYDDSSANSPDAELKLDLSVGFRGNPSIGTVVYNELKDDQAFKTFLSSCQATQGDRVFIVGSVFGGTGSSGIPVIVDEIRRATTGDVASVPVGVALLLPYFALDAMSATAKLNGDTGAIDSTMFNAKTKTALASYAIGGPNSFNNRVDDLYYIGDTIVDKYEYHEGRNNQTNPAHVAEWVAATAIVEFMQASRAHGAGLTQEFGISSDNTGDAIMLPDLRDDARRDFAEPLAELVIAMRYYREVVCGTRNKVRVSASYYNMFDLDNRLKNSLYGQINKFVTDPNYGLYAWLGELASHDHAFKPFDLKAVGKDIGNVLSHKRAKKGFITSNPAADNTISSILDDLAKRGTGTTDADFLKILRKAAEKTYSQIIK